MNPKGSIYGDNIMGFFSFLASDDRKSIPCQSEGEWWLVTPTGKIKLTYYDGYGRFTTESGEVIDVHCWLARINYPNKDWDDETARMIGVNLRLSSFYVDHLLNKYACEMHMKDFAGEFGGEFFLFEDYCTPFEVLGVMATANDHISEGRLNSSAIMSEFGLKIVSNESNAEYEKVGEVSNCPNQGL